jgi:glycine amidinotransferase
MIFGPNGLTAFFVTDPAFHRIGQASKVQRIAREYVDFSISRSFGRAFRCSTQTVARVKPSRT